jgi:hypothetical protein
MKSALSLALVVALVTSSVPVAAQERIDPTGGPIHRAMASAAIRAVTEPAVAAGQSPQADREEVVNPQSTPATEQCKKASSIAKSFEMLQAIVRYGDTLLVRDANGRKIKGTLQALSGASLDLLVWNNGQRRRLSELDVRDIEIECPDSLWNGTLIGMAVAGGVLFLSAAGGSGTGGYSTAELWGGIAGYIGFGAAVGALIDYSREDTVTIYRAADRRSSRVLVFPRLSKSVAGVQMAVRF